MAIAANLPLYNNLHDTHNALQILNMTVEKLEILIPKDNKWYLVNVLNSRDKTPIEVNGFSNKTSTNS